MPNSFTFKVGDQFENEKGKYEVLCINTTKGNMSILPASSITSKKHRWENGEEIETTIRLQEKILRRRACDEKLRNKGIDPNKIIEIPEDDEDYELMDSYEFMRLNEETGFYIFPEDEYDDGAWKDDLIFSREKHLLGFLRRNL